MATVRSRTRPGRSRKQCLAPRPPSRTGNAGAPTSPNSSCRLRRPAHDHSLSEWEEAWQREHQADDRFPAFLVPLATVP